ncbi:hypothetical protein EB796_003737 [Bugula neritina]|uniref:Flavin-containing monooxygenase n=1 Tax=Bugula neritina TaxID=10212 RepID=A0A7J7KHA9_BUGNE|nr:hypothetical protein EB796_003737 [Bugula neritina]
MDKPTKVIEAVVIGGGISGLVTLKSLRQKGINCILCESKEHHGGLWHFSPSNYGVMEFTHINVSKYNYAFSDFPFPAGAVDYPHHSQMAEYIDQYVDNNQLYNHILYRTRVLHVSRYQDEEKDRKLWKLRCHSGASASEFDMYCRYLIIATGHHAKPKVPEFPGQSNFTVSAVGEIIHSVDYKDSKTHGFEDKNTVVVGIGNSAVDVAVNCAERKSKSGHGKVYLSTRSGAWVVPNYVFSVPTDLYASRFFLNWLPFPVKQFVFETILRLIHGSPQNPEIGSELAFIGFVQPSSGGVLPISEIQAQWLAMVIKGGATLPSAIDMKESIALERGILSSKVSS